MVIVDNIVGVAVASAAVDIATTYSSTSSLMICCLHAFAEHHLVAPVPGTSSSNNSYVSLLPLNTLR